ncbi:MAG TPA: polysaccharide deacetylase family protein [Solirubrobacteraceae bacterium]|jgi:peptidoglycan/xylan/chitin deacetylase (PgdA/CDA1 family)|nr:polysaccharide deacetylase family protein [Solirubrobacteraceae bacterium]
MRHGHGPEALERAIVLTFDNLGEASSLQRGTWNPRTPLGEDPSVTRALPRLLDALEHSGLTATFFVEAVNCELNPEALAQIAERGHEMGAHGWQHEQWGELDTGEEREVLARTARAFAAAGLGVHGFRPPGGELTPRTPGLLREHGFAWCSPAGDQAPSVRDGLALVPFDWEQVDAYHLLERFGDLRVRRGAPAQPRDAADTGARLARALRDGGGGGGVQTLVMHPFLMLDPAWWEQTQGLLALVAELARSGQAWVVPGGRLAESLGRE